MDIMKPQRTPEGKAAVAVGAGAKLNQAKSFPLLRASGGRPWCVMLVEDDAEVRDLIRTVLLQLGCEVISADSDAKAQGLWERHSHEVDLLIADMLIPNCATGLDVARRFRKDRPELRVIFISGFGPEISGEDDPLLHESLFLRKPFTVASLLNTLTLNLAGAPCAETVIA
jgi:CheY-like chemotaxis protein